MTPTQYHKDKLKFFKSAAIFVFEIIKAFVISLAIILPIRYFLIQPFYVQGASMEPTFQSHDYLIINEFEYRFHIKEPARGDVVVFRSPYNQKEYFIKRIIGLPGEKVEIKEGQIYINNQEQSQGFILKEDYLAGVRTFAEDKQYKEIQLSDEEYFVLGDNRNYSLDSRTFGAVPDKSIIGRAWIRGWPFSKMIIFGKINYNETVE
jgi:signal peptidase I